MNGFTGLKGSKKTFSTLSSNIISKLMAAPFCSIFMSVLAFEMFLKYFLKHTARCLVHSTLVCGV